MSQRSYRGTSKAPVEPAPIRRDDGGEYVFDSAIHRVGKDIERGVHAAERDVRVGVQTIERGVEDVGREIEDIGGDLLDYSKGLFDRTKQLGESALVTARDFIKDPAGEVRGLEWADYYASDPRSRKLVSLMQPDFSLDKGSPDRYDILIFIIAIIILVAIVRFITK